MTKGETLAIINEKSNQVTKLMVEINDLAVDLDSDERHSIFLTIAGGNAGCFLAPLLKHDPAQFKQRMRQLIGITLTSATTSGAMEP